MLKELDILYLTKGMMSTSVSGLGGTLFMELNRPRDENDINISWR